MQDLEVIKALCAKLGGLTAAAIELSTDDQQFTPQHVHNWKRRGRVSPQQRLHFLTVFNRVMPKAAHLDLTWLASPAATSNGSDGHGRKSGRKKAAKGKARKAQARPERGKQGARRRT